MQAVDQSGLGVMAENIADELSHFIRGAQPWDIRYLLARLAELAPDELREAIRLTMERGR